MLRGYRDIAKRIDPQLLHLFGKSPRLTYGVSPVPAYAEKSQTTAYYEPGSPRTGRANFFANTYDLKARPKWEMEALTLHEAVPGHHLQIALALEPDVLPFRRYGVYTAYIEGWGLYSESLGDELGLYQDPYSKFGQLTLRNVARDSAGRRYRHAFAGLEPPAGHRLFRGSTGQDHEPGITVEVDRYIVWPGQALAYKIGQLKITGLREEAKRQLGEKFDIRHFHDVVPWQWCGATRHARGAG